MEWINKNKSNLFNNLRKQKEMNLHLQDSFNFRRTQPYLPHVIRV